MFYQPEHEGYPLGRPETSLETSGEITDDSEAQETEEKFVPRKGFSFFDNEPSQED